MWSTTVFYGNVIVSNKPYMSTVKFILSKSQHQRKVQSKSSMVMLRYTHNKQSVLFFTHKNIEDDYWDHNNPLGSRSPVQQSEAKPKPNKPEHLPNLISVVLIIFDF